MALPLFVALGASAVGTFLSIRAQKKQAKAQQAALNAQAAAKRVAAFEILDRFDVNAATLKRQGRVFLASQVAAAAKAGVDVRSGSVLSALEDTKSKIQRQFLIEKREAEFKSTQLLQGADIDVRLGGDIRTAQKRQTIATLIGGVGGAAAAFK